MKVFPLNRMTCLLLGILALQQATPQETAICIEMTPPDVNCDDSCAIMKADRAFNARAQEIGVPAAFLEFAAEDAVMYRNGMEPIVGKAAIAEVMADEENVSLVWKPITCDMAESDDLGYSRGSFVMNIPAQGNEQPAQGPFEGFYVSIWKKQPDGSWKWVFDSGIISRMPPR